MSSLRFTGSKKVRARKQLVCKSCLPWGPRSCVLLLELELGLVRGPFGPGSCPWLRRTAPAKKERKAISLSENALKRTTNRQPLLLLLKPRPSPSPSPALGPTLSPSRLPLAFTFAPCAHEPGRPPFQSPLGVPVVPPSEQSSSGVGVGLGLGGDSGHAKAAEGS